ncbi:putative DnaJ domain, Chaperone J-domain superfamily [Helianthus annuus]|nr:putative DnaJ domain, Chaperone J-domain superfamily [Helianthus annuus]
MQSRLLPVPASFAGTGTTFSLHRSYNRNLNFRSATSPSIRRRPIAVTFSVANNQQDHYAVLGLSTDASQSDIKKAYRLLARKYHPDVNKDSQASEVFKSVHLAYEVLSNNTTRSQYDKSLHFQPKSSPPWRTHNINFEYEMKTHRWSDSRQKMKYRKGYGFDEVDGVTNERGSFINVVRSAFLSLFLLKTIGAKLSLTFSSVTALLDPELDGGYKVGYLVAWMMGGRGGIMLALCLPFASWICGKASSNVVALGAVSMWVGSVLARVAPLPQGAVLTLLYMSFKLQADLN